MTLGPKRPLICSISLKMLWSRASRVVDSTKDISTPVNTITWR